MATPVSALVLRIRHELRDYGVGMFALDSGVNESATSFQLDHYPFNALDNQRAAVGVEDVRIVAATNPLIVDRGYNGTTAASHSAGELVIIEPRFSNQEVLDALVQAQTELAGFIPYRPTPDTTNTIAVDTEEYAAPAGARAIELVEVEKSTSGLYRPWANFQILDADPPKVRVIGAPTGRTLRLTYHADYTPFVWTTADINSEIDARYNTFLVDWAKGELLASEAGFKARVVAAAKGQGASVQDGLVAAQTLKAAALAKLQASRPASRVIQRPATTGYRMR